MAGGMLVCIGAALFIWSAVMFDATQAQNVCDNCMVLGGMGFAGHPDNCGMYLQCVPDGNGWIPYERKCIEGMFWNAARFACVRPVSVTCSNDPCLNTNNNIGVPHTVYCGAYWVCENNRAQSLECCPNGQQYSTSAQRCVNSVTCFDNQCHYLNDGTGSSIGCVFSADPQQPNRFRSFENGVVRHIFTCALGTIWDDDKCTCDFDPSYVPPVYVQLTGAACLDLSLLLNVDTGFRDSSQNGPSGAGWYVYAGDAQIRTIASANGNGALYCDGGTATYPSIPRYANIDFGYLRVDLNYLLSDNIAINGDNRDLALFSNSMCDGVSTVSIAVDRNNLNLQARVSVFGQATAYTVNVNPRRGRSGNLNNVWVSVSFVYTGETMSITTNANTANVDSDSVAVAGPILTAPTGIRLCDGSGYRSFEGYLDDFTVYTCNPN